MVANSLERRRATEFEPRRGGWSLFSTDKLEQLLQITLPFNGIVNVCLCLNVASRHSGDFDFLSARQQD